MNSDDELLVRNPMYTFVVDQERVVYYSVTSPLREIRDSQQQVWKILSDSTGLLTRSRACALLGISADELSRIVEPLIDAGVLLSTTSSGFQKMVSIKATRKVCMKKPPTVVFGICGSIQAVFMLPVLMALEQQLDAIINVVLTSDGARFLPKSTIEMLGYKVWDDSYQREANTNVAHVSLAQTADVVLIAPATANTLAKLSQGLCSDLLNLVVVATTAPVVVAPCMNDVMLAKPAIRRNINTLQQDGFHIVLPGFGFEISRAVERKRRFCGAGIDPTNVSRLVSWALQTRSQHAVRRECSRESM